MTGLISQHKCVSYLCLLKPQMFMCLNQLLHHYFRIKTSSFCRAPWLQEPEKPNETPQPRSFIPAHLPQEGGLIPQQSQAAATTEPSSRDWWLLKGFSCLPRLKKAAPTVKYKPKQEGS